MASLPSVVLGFLAGLVIAPAAESIVPAIVTSLFAVPVVLLLAAHLWQLLPVELAVRWARWRLLVILLVVPLGIVVRIRHRADLGANSVRRRSQGLARQRPDWHRHARMVCDPAAALRARDRLGHGQVPDSAIAAGLRWLELGFTRAWSNSFGLSRHVWRPCCWLGWQPYS